MSESCMCDECVAWRKRLMKAELARERSTTPPTEPARRVSDEVIDLALDDLKAIGDEGSKLDRWQERERDGWLDLRDERAARVQDAATIEALTKALEHANGCWMRAGKRAESAEARLAELAETEAKLRDLVQTLIDNDPNDMAADGVTVLDVWRNAALAALSAKQEQKP